MLIHKAAPMSSVAVNPRIITTGTAVSEASRGMSSASVSDSPETVAARKSVLSRQIELDQQAATLRAEKAKLEAREADLAERLKDLAERESKVCPATLTRSVGLHSAQYSADHAAGSSVDIMPTGARALPAQCASKSPFNSQSQRLGC